jgi:phosphoribosylformimino-5-aminoimidazole carboxamide ribotide isomerase
MFKDPAWVRKASREFPGRIVAGIDARNGEVQVEGWQQGSGVPVAQAVRLAEQFGIAEVVFTEISHDGHLQGPAMDAIRTVLAATKLGIIASGGVSSAADVKTLKGLEANGLRGCIVGKALYDGRLSLTDALAAAK